jgi:hypothetical protein
MVGRFDSFQLPEGSLYQDYSHNVRDRLEAARGKDAMSLVKFSEEIIKKATRANPPEYVLTGGKAGLFKVMAWLPRSMTLNIVWGMFSKPKRTCKFPFIHYTFICNDNLITFLSMSFRIP